MGKFVQFPHPDGATSTGYFSFVGEGRPGVIVVQEWWGLNDQICGVVDRYARCGFNALAPDLYSGRVTQEPDEATHLMAGLDLNGAIEQDLQGAVRHLKQSSPRICVTGYCIGGLLAVAALVHVPDVDAGICFYGLPDHDFADPSLIAKPLQGHFAEHDTWCTPAKVDALQKAMEKVTPTPEIFRYAVEHGFCNEREEAYDVANSELAWKRSMAFMEAHMN